MTLHDRSLVNLLTMLIFVSGCSKNDDPVVDCSQVTVHLRIESTTPPSSCDRQDGMLTIAVDGGVGPYTFEANTGSTVISQSSPQFTGLFAGLIQITVRDKFKCGSELSVDLRNSTKSGVSYSGQIVPILNANCTLTGCHNGDLNASRDWRSLSAIRAKLNNFQRILTLKKMPPPPNSLLSDAEVSLILCWIADGALDN